jgi:hypothetical protein
MYDTQLIKLPIATIEICVAFLAHAYIVYLCFKFKDTIYKGVKSYVLKAPALVGLCLILSMIFHPGSKGTFFFTFQMFVSFSIFLEGAALVP